MKRYAKMTVRVPCSLVAGDRAEADQILAVATGLMLANEAWFRAHPDAPCCLGCAEARYVPPESCGPLCQVVDSAAMVLQRKEATCISAAAYEAGKLRADGTPASLAVQPVIGRDGRPVLHAWHVVVVMPDGKIHDPTAELQIGGCGCVGGCAHE